MAHIIPKSPTSFDFPKKANCACALCLMAERANMSVMTLRAVERGSPHVSMGNYMAVVACLGFQDDVARVASDDVLGRDLQDAAL